MGRSYINREGEEKKDNKAHASMEMDLAFGNPTEVESWDNELWLEEWEDSTNSDEEC